MPVQYRFEIEATVLKAEDPTAWVVSAADPGESACAGPPRRPGRGSPKRLHPGCGKRCERVFLASGAAHPILPIHSKICPRQCQTVSALNRRIRERAEVSALSAASKVSMVNARSFMVWNKTNILSALRKLHKSGADLSYNALAKRDQSLVSAAAYHFGSYRKAVEKGGIDYATVTRRPRWDRASIIRIIKSAKRNGEDLHWSAVTRRRDELGRAAFAALQPRLFGNWERALTASGLDADEISRYRRWDKDSIVFELRCRYREHQPLNSGSLQSEDPGLHAAAVRHFGNYDGALRAARLDPQRVRRRQSWDKPTVLKTLKAIRRDGSHLSDSAVRREHPALYGASVRLFGSFTSARTAAGILLKPQWHGFPSRGRGTPRRSTVLRR